MSSFDASDFAKRLTQGSEAKIAGAGPSKSVNLDLDEISGGDANVWHFTVKAAGKVFATRPLTAEDVERVDQLRIEAQHAMRNPLDVLADMKELAASIFIGDAKPTIDDVGAMHLLREVVLYYVGWQRRRIESFRKVQQAAIGSLTTKGGLS